MKKKRTIDATPARFGNGRANSANAELKGMRRRAQIGYSEEGRDTPGRQSKKGSKLSKDKSKSPTSQKMRNLEQRQDRAYSYDPNDHKAIAGIIPAEVFMKQSHKNITISTGK